MFKSRTDKQHLLPKCPLCEGTIGRTCSECNGTGRVTMVQRIKLFAKAIIEEERLTKR